MAVQAQHTCQRPDEKCGEPVASVSAIAVTKPLMVRSNGRATIKPRFRCLGDASTSRCFSQRESETITVVGPSVQTAPSLPAARDSFHSRLVGKGDCREDHTHVGPGPRPS